MPNIHQEDGFLKAKDNLPLFWCVSRPAGTPRAAIALLHGYLDHSGRYGEVISLLASRGFVVYALDFRGHGQSGGKRAFVDSYTEYLDDLDTFLAFVREKEPNLKRFLIAHSQGGLIGIRYLMSHPDAVSGAAFSAPYLRPIFQPVLKAAAARVLSRVLPALRLATGLGADTLTSDVAIQKATESDVLYQHHATPRWFTEVTATQDEVMRRATEFVTPFVALVPEADPVADPRATQRFVEHATSKDKRYVGFAGLRHEPFNEVKRQEVFAALLSWLEARSGETDARVQAT